MDGAFAILAPGLVMALPQTQPLQTNTLQEAGSSLFEMLSTLHNTLTLIGPNLNHQQAKRLFKSAQAAAALIGTSMKVTSSKTHWRRLTHIDGASMGLPCIHRSSVLQPPTRFSTSRLKL